MDQKKFQLIPNTNRVLLKRLNLSEKAQANAQILIPGQLKAGENLYLGEVINGGDTKFKPGDLVYYSEYSAAALFDLGPVQRGEIPYSQVLGEGNAMFIVAEDDIMAYETVEKKK